MTHQTNCTAFHNEESLAICSLDGVLHLWDVETGAKKVEYTPASHLTSTFTCLSWKIQQSLERRKLNGTPVKRKLKTQKENNSNKDDVIALGTTTGEILLYQVQTGEVIGKLDGEHSDKVNCVCWDRDDQRLFSCSEDQHIVHWDLTSYKSVCKWQGDKRGVKSICIGPHSTLISAGKTIKLWDLETKALLRRFTGHASPVLNLSFVNFPSITSKQDASPLELVEGSYFLSSAVDDRVINVWQIQKKHRRIAVASFSLNSKPVSMDIKSPTSKDQPITLLVLTDEGEINLFSHTLNGQMKKPLDVQMTVKVVDPSAKQLKIISASLCNDTESETATLLIGYGTTLKVVFERLNLDNYTTKDVCIIRENPMKIKIKLAENALKTREPIRINSEVTTLAPGVPGHTLKIATVTEQDIKIKHKRKKTISMSESEMTMEDRLNAIGLKRGSDSNTENQPPRADSLSVLLSQGLQSNDKEILNRVLQNTNENLIRNTVKRLPLSLIVALVQDLTTRMRSSPAAAFKFVKWLRETLKIHSSYLMTFPDLVPLLSQLYQLMDARTETHNKFVKLEGKLELLATQIKSKKTLTENKNIDTTPLFVYEDESSDEQEDILMDDLPVDASDSSDNEWEEMSGKDDKEQLMIDEDETDSGVVGEMMEED